MHYLDSIVYSIVQEPLFESKDMRKIAKQRLLYS